MIKGSGIRTSCGSKFRNETHDGCILAGSGPEGIESVRLESQEDVTKATDDGIRSSNDFYQKVIPVARSCYSKRMQHFAKLHQPKYHPNQTQLRIALGLAISQE